MSDKKICKSNTKVSISYFYIMQSQPPSVKNIVNLLLPPAVGYSYPLFKKLLKENNVQKKYRGRVIAIKLINWVNMPFRSYERKVINPRIAQDAIDEAPIFIIGHWRSGTTHLHNLMCQDKQMGFVTTYQGVFPDTLFNKAGRFIFKNFTTFLIPPTRKGDNVKLDPNYPQEEEFALGSRDPFCYYYFWIFPDKTLEFFKKYIQFKGITDAEKVAWQMDYEMLIKKALKNTGRQVFLSKNPPNTGRIDQLLEVFPNARFIHIHRNPVEVFLSTRHFFRKMMPHLELNSISEQQLEDTIIKVYKELMNDFLNKRSLIPEERFIEVSYGELEDRPGEILGEIYQKLSIKGFREAKPAFLEYLERSKGYQKNKHTISKPLLNKILSEWDFTMKEWDYDVPDTIEIED